MKVRTRVAAVIAGFCALPCYWLELSYLLSLAVQSPRLVDWIATSGAVVLGCLTVGMWLRSARSGAILQITLLLPGVIGIFATHRSSGPRFGGVNDVDLGFVIGVLIVAVVPGVLLGVALLVLSKMRARGR